MITAIVLHHKMESHDDSHVDSPAPCKLRAFVFKTSTQTFAKSAALPWTKKKGYNLGQLRPQARIVLTAADYLLTLSGERAVAAFNGALPVADVDDSFLTSAAKHCAVIFRDAGAGDIEAPPPELRVIKLFVAIFGCFSASSPRASSSAPRTARTAATCHRRRLLGMRRRHRALLCPWKSLGFILINFFGKSDASRASAVATATRFLRTWIRPVRGRAPRRCRRRAARPCGRDYGSSGRRAAHPARAGPRRALGAAGGAPAAGGRSGGRSGTATHPPITTKSKTTNC